MPDLDLEPKDYRERRSDDAEEDEPPPSWEGGKDPARWILFGLMMFVIMWFKNRT